jgi:hypothetical protein
MYRRQADNAMCTNTNAFCKHRDGVAIFQVVNLEENRHRFAHTVAFGFQKERVIQLYRERLDEIYVVNPG